MEPHYALLKELFIQVSFIIAAAEIFGPKNYSVRTVISCFAFLVPL
jgi:hypothetical protein